MIPRRDLAKEDRSGRVTPYQERDDREERCKEHEPAERHDDVQRALDKARRAREPYGRETEQRQSFDRVDSDARPDQLESTRHDVDLYVLRSQAPHDREDALVVVLRKCDDDALDVELTDELRETLEWSEHRQVLEARTAIAWRVVHEADQVDSVLRVMEELPGNELADVAGADDDRVLEVHQPLSDARPHGGAADDQQRDRNQPEDDHAAGRRSRKTEEPRDGDERPRSGRDELEDTDEVVHRRVIGSDVVAVIEAEDLRRDHPRRKGCEQDEDLYSGRKGRERAGQREGESEPDHVRDEEQSPHQPAAATAPAAYPPAPEDLKRAGIDGVEHTFVQDEVLGEDRVGRSADRSRA